MDSIQKVNLYLGKFKELKLNKKIKNMDFEKTVEIMMNKYVLHITKGLIISLKKLINYEGDIINNREMLSSFMIKFHKTDVLSSELSEQEQLIYDKSVELVDYLTNLNSTITKLEACDMIKKLNTFKYVFKNWKKADKESQITIYCDMYHDYTNKINKLE